MANFHNNHRERERRTGWARRLDDILLALAPTEADDGDALRPSSGACLPAFSPDAARSTRDARRATVNGNPRKERRP